MSTVHVAPCSFVLPQPPILGSNSVSWISANASQAAVPSTSSVSWKSTNVGKRNPQVISDVIDKDTASPKIRRKALMQSVHDVGTALHSLCLATPASHLHCADNRSESSSCFGELVDMEPQSQTNEYDRDHRSHFSGVSVDDDDIICEGQALSDVGILMDSNLFAEKVSHCSRITLAQNTLRSVRDVLNSTKNQLPSDSGALIVYRAPSEVIEESMVRAARATGAARAAMKAANEAREITRKIEERAQQFREHSMGMMVDDGSGEQCGMEVESSRSA
eukprot:CAMPEP_0113669976 /NCGR_PEP_ID=MMETSP0038_2-20120614/4877_1 /TAXON_ID=2898 /ORGANISM="Cryptomonas paramecium" /LENGTH=276 /DNA_ID=CAMNT_0000585935 /DNA_START=17 /DNA_END=843 /DNA_ORIENTATION=- /assembly_acc=CAM_ASM_000170